jgi:hypothetical protein
MRTLLPLFTAALLIGATGCAKKDDAAAPMDQGAPQTTTPAEPAPDTTMPPADPSMAPTDPNAPPPPADQTGTPPGSETPPPPQQ